jgi:hypothetical protein
MDKDGIQLAMPSLQAFSVLLKVHSFKMNFPAIDLFPERK